MAETEKQIENGLLILDAEKISLFPLVEKERENLIQAAKLLKDGYCEYALLGLWNAAVSNLKRRAEAYGVDLWLSIIKEEPGRKKYDKDGETLSERWEGVDDLVLISGATNLGVLNKKAGKSLEMINWMRNHASGAHDTDEKVGPEDVFAIALLLQKNLFSLPIPDPGHSVSSLFDPIKNGVLSSEQIIIFRDEIKVLRNQDVRICFGFMLDILCGEESPAVNNVFELFPDVWERSNEDLRKTAGMKYHFFTFEVNPQDSSKAAKNRLRDFLIKVKGIKYVPDAARAQLYRHAAKKLAEAKDTAYGWRDEEVIAKTLAQFGSNVPSVAFEEVYQEILAVWCGNYWGRSTCYIILADFIEHLNTDQILQVTRMFRENERVKRELFQKDPKKHAIEFLSSLEPRLTIETHKEEVRRAIQEIERFSG